MAQGSVAPEGKHGGFSSGSKLEEKILSASVIISLAGSLAVGYFCVKQNYCPLLAESNDQVISITKTNQPLQGAVEGYYPGK